MQLVPVSRMAYRDRFDVGFLASLSAQFGRFYLIPEGGSNAVGVQGVADAVVAAIDSAGCLRNPRSDTQTSPLIFCCPLGSGGTLAGMISGVTRALVARRLESCACLGVSALKGDKEAPARVRRLLETTMESCDAVPWRVEQGFHGGGFGRVTAELLQFMREFESRNGLLLDPVYTAKMMFALVAMAREGEFAPGSRLLVLHTGGLQGRRGVPALMQPRTESGEQVDNAWLTSGKL